MAERIPPDPGVAEHDFRMTPSRISARRTGHAWIIYEKTARSKMENILRHASSWTEAYRLGLEICERLGNRTSREAGADGVLL